MNFFFKPPNNNKGEKKTGGNLIFQKSGGMKLNFGKKGKSSSSGSMPLFFNKKGGSKEGSNDKKVNFSFTSSKQKKPAITINFASKPKKTKEQVTPTTPQTPQINNVKENRTPKVGEDNFPIPLSPRTPKKDIFPIPLTPKEDNFPIPQTPPNRQNIESTSPSPSPYSVPKVKAKKKKLLPFKTPQEMFGQDFPKVNISPQHTQKKNVNKKKVVEDKDVEMSDGPKKVSKSPPQFQRKQFITFNRKKDSDVSMSDKRPSKSPKRLFPSRLTSQFQRTTRKPTFEAPHSIPSSKGRIRSRPPKAGSPQSQSVSNNESSESQVILNDDSQNTIHQKLMAEKNSLREMQKVLDEKLESEAQMTKIVHDMNEEMDILMEGLQMAETEVQVKTFNVMMLHDPILEEKVNGIMNQFKDVVDGKNDTNNFKM